jgi:hypothetical protein|tara:strand:- start:2843 stop:3028 length:186 start_codon:yes stop_codon:yes gene_type:complete
MKTEKIQKLIELRTILIKDFHRRKDWKSNKNAIMREIEHVELLNETIKKIDGILAGDVTFS